MVTVTSTEIEDVKVIGTKVFEDTRGSFSETYNFNRFADNGITINFVQDNESYSERVGTVRGMHFQSHPFAQDKLVRVLSGRILDVAVDMRQSSLTFRHWVARELSSENRLQMLVPAGFAHGFCTLEVNTRVAYKVSASYSPENDRGFLWNDPSIGIKWPIAINDAVLSDKDVRQPSFDQLPVYFK